MYGLAQLLPGVARVEARGASPARFLNACAAADIRFRDASPTDEFGVCLTLRRRDVKRAAALAGRSQCELRLLQERGLPVTARRLKGRWALLAGFLLCCAALVWSSLHVWELEVTGNDAASTAEILAALDRADVRIGSYWPAFSNDRIKSIVLQEVPELSWISVNVRGSRAVASVRERIPPPTRIDERAAVQVVAEKAGLVTRLEVLRGAAAVKKGQTVTAGETLISGAVASAFEKAGSRAVHARGAVWARTWYALTACARLERQEKVYTGEETLRFALEIGDRRINFYNLDGNSGNSAMNCDKIERSYKLAIEGVFTTPLGLVTQRLREYELHAVPEDRAALRGSLEAALTARLEREIGADGQVENAVFSASEDDGMLYVTLRAECLEDIAREEAFVFMPPEISDTKGDSSQ